MHVHNKDIEHVTLEGKRVRLVPLSPAHLDDLTEIGLEPELWRWTTIRVQSREEMELYIERALEPGSMAFAIEHQGHVVGTTRFHHIAPFHRRVEVGFTWIGVPWQGRGLNTECKYLMLRHAFQTLGCVRVEFKADAENTASRAALESIGARFEAVLRSFMFSEHKGPRDIAVYSIIEEEWPDVSAALEKRI